MLYLDIKKRTSGSEIVIRLLDTFHLLSMWSFWMMTDFVFTMQGEMQKMATITDDLSSIFGSIHVSWFKGFHIYFHSTTTVQRT